MLVLWSLLSPIPSVFPSLFGVYCHFYSLRGLSCLWFFYLPCAFVSQSAILQWCCSTADVFQKLNGRSGLSQCGCASTSFSSHPCQSRWGICFQTLWRSLGLWSDVGWSGEGRNASPLSTGAMEAPGPSPLPSLLETGLEAAENKWTLLQFSASHMDFITLSYVMNKLTYARRFTCQRVICCTSM